MVGGATSIAAGWLLVQFAAVKFDLFGRTWGHFHLMFAISMVLRWVACVLVQFLREPNSKHTAHIFGELLDGMPWRILTFPAGLYRNFTRQELELDPTGEVAVSLPEVADAIAQVDAPQSGVPAPNYSRRKLTAVR
jgi:hypothetical protein